MSTALFQGVICGAEHQGPASSLEAACTVRCLSGQCVETVADGTRTKTRSILYDWVQELGLRHQGVILAAMRGCDGVGKQDVTKPLMRAIRAVTLVPYDARELNEPKGYMYFTPESFLESIKVVSKSMDEYPLHFILHLIHGLEVIGYKHPVADVRNAFRTGYETLVRKFHMTPEAEAHMDERLTEDRVKNQTVQG